jgi:CRP-like cAMP-binding protein
MAPVARFSTGNRLLRALASSDFELLAPDLMPVVLPLEQEIEQPNKRIGDVVFPDSGVISVVARHPDNTRVEIGVIGTEGMSGVAVLLGNERSPHATYVQVAGGGKRIAAVKLRNAMKASRSLRTLLHKYVQAFMVQTAHTAAANARATLAQRLARWLLMAHDRLPTDKVPLTHEFLALMVGVRRAGVSEALRELVQHKLVRTGRGEIVILNRRGIEKLAEHFYGVPETEYRRVIG